MTISLLKPTEWKVLFTANRTPHGSLLVLRKSLSISLDLFSETIGALESKGLISRTGLKVRLTTQGVDALKEQRYGPLGESQGNYVISVSVPKLAVTDFYLPNREKFLASLTKSK